MNITLSLDARTLDRARKLAASMDKSLNQLIREYLEELTSGDPRADLEELERLSRKGRGRSRGWRFDRDEVHGRA